MNEAEEFLENNCLWINERHWRHGEKKLYQIGAKTLEQYAQQRELIAFKNGWKAAEKLNKWNTNNQNQEDET